MGFNPFLYDSDTNVMRVYHLHHIFNILMCGPDKVTDDYQENGYKRSKPYEYYLINDYRFHQSW